MKLSKHSCILSTLLAVFMLVSCAGGNSGSPPATSAESGDTATVDHKPSRDTVNWNASSIDGQPPWIGQADREWPGEEMGLIGPIIAMGGSGSKTYVAVYDPGGVFIGALYLKEARENPQHLESLIRLAHHRGVLQNSRAADHIAARRFIGLVQAANQKGVP